ncbi:hypothetical protein GJAV_G00245930 [Gymnothorax javanicus]|nr:hypothetical protein GJAV_G00245930 [Gymnothorax javanicus]
MQLSLESLVRLPQRPPSNSLFLCVQDPDAPGHRGPHTRLVPGLHPFFTLTRVQALRPRSFWQNEITDAALYPAAHRDQPHPDQRTQARLPESETEILQTPLCIQAVPASALTGAIPLSKTIERELFKIALERLRGDDMHHAKPCGRPSEAAEKAKGMDDCGGDLEGKPILLQLRSRSMRYKARITQQSPVLTANDSADAH